MRKIYACGLLLLTSIIYVNAQEAPTTGKKVLEVKEIYEGEYMQKVTKGDLSNTVINALKKRVPSKLKKYGFEDIKIIEIGKVKTPVSLASKMSNAAGGNEAVGKSQLELAKTSTEINSAVNKIHEEDYDIDWKFQVNFIDINTNKEYKVRLNQISYNPKYIIKENKIIIDLRK